MDEREVDAEELKAVPSARPALIALMVVVAVSMVMIIGTLIVGKQTSDRARRIATESLQSVQALGALRDRVMQLQSVSPGRRNVLEQQIARDVVEYAPLATAPGEAAEWARLTTVIKAYMVSSAEPAVRDAQLDHIVASFERLREINVMVATRRIARIERTQRTALVAQIVGGVITLLAAGVVATILARVMRRQRELTRHVLDTLTERNRELTEFARRAAHDLRAPLSPIRGYADLLAEGAPIDTKRAISRIRSASITMSNIIDNLLALSVSGQLPAGTAAVPTLVNAILDEMSDQLAGAQVVTDLSECTAACAPSVLGQLLQNVLANASKYRDPDRPLIVQIAAKCDSRQVELSVEDNGLGMTPDAIAHAFEATYRGPSSASVGGHGLGLAIVKRTLDAIGGTCSLASEPNRGTKVVMRFPTAS